MTGIVSRCCNGFLSETTVKLLVVFASVVLWTAALNGAQVTCSSPSETKVIYDNGYCDLSGPGQLRARPFSWELQLGISYDGWVAVILDDTSWLQSAADLDDSAFPFTATTISNETYSVATTPGDVLRVTLQMSSGTRGTGTAEVKIGGTSMPIDQTTPCYQCFFTMTASDVMSIQITGSYFFAQTANSYTPSFALNAGQMFYITVFQYLPNGVTPDMLPVQAAVPEPSCFCMSGVALLWLAQRLRRPSR